MYLKAPYLYRTLFSVLLLQLCCFLMFPASATAQQHSPDIRNALADVGCLDGECPKEPPLGSLAWKDKYRYGLLSLARALDRQPLSSQEQNDLAALVTSFKTTRIYFPECGYRLSDIPIEDIEIQSGALDDYLKSVEDGLDLVNGRASITNSDSCELDNDSLSDERTQTGVDYLQRVKGRPGSQVCGRSLSKNGETYLTLTQAQGILPTLPLDWNKYAPNAKPTLEMIKKEGEKRAKYLAQKIAMINQSVEIIRIPHKVGFLLCPPPGQSDAIESVRATLDELDALRLYWGSKEWIDDEAIANLYGFIDRPQPLPDRRHLFRRSFSTQPKSNHLPEQSYSKPKSKGSESLHYSLTGHAVMPLLPLPHSWFLQTLSIGRATSITPRKRSVSNEEAKQMESVNQAAQVCKKLFPQKGFWRYIERNDDMAIKAGDIIGSISGSVNRKLDTGLDILSSRSEHIWQRITKDKDISLTAFFLKPLLSTIPAIRFVKSNEELLYAEILETSVRYIEEEVSETKLFQLVGDIAYALSGASPNGAPRDRPQLILVARRVTKACWVQTGNLKVSLGERHVDISSLQIRPSGEFVHIESGRRVGDARCQERGPGAVKVEVFKARDGRLVIQPEPLDSENMEGWHMTQDGRLAQTISYQLEEDSPDGQSATIYDIAKYHFDHSSFLGPNSSVLRCVVDNYDYLRNGGMWAL